MLQRLSPNSDTSTGISRTSLAIEVIDLEKKYKNGIYTRSQLKKLAITYHLRLLPAAHFTGKFDHAAGMKLNQFIKEQGLVFKKDEELGERFYILAPQENFRLVDTQHIYAAQRRILEDPLLFYKVPGKDLFVKIHKWGKDFTILRFIDGLRWKSFWSRLTFHTFAMLPVTMAFSAWLFSLETLVTHTGGFMALSIVLSFVFSYFQWSFKTHDEGKAIKEFFSPDKWNRTYLYH